jgi:NAD(P)-dependent dehydrogenase (short-subunit alcohol dehydrogenase family)
MKNFSGRLAVITGAGSGMGRELARQLSAEGCHVALCDVVAENLRESASLCTTRAPAGTRVSTTECDVSDEAQVLAFRDAVQRDHGTRHINLLFNNAGIGGGGSFIADSREHWEKTFAVCWGGVYYCTRAFMPLLIASDEGHLINTSSINGFWACFGNAPHTAYSSAKFAVKGFTEALMIDTRVHAPHVKVSLVMPGHIGTGIVANSTRILHGRAIEDLTADQLEPFRAVLTKMGVPAETFGVEDLRGAFRRFSEVFEQAAPMSAAEAATVILDGVRQRRWRILVGADAEALDRSVRATPEEAYEPHFLAALAREGHFRGTG